MSGVEETEVTLEDIATMCEENQEELADLILQEVPFYSFIKTEPLEEIDTTTVHHTQVTHLLECDMAVTDLTDIAHEETCCSNDCYNTERAGSPFSEDSTCNLSPQGRKKCSSSRRNRTPNSLQHLMEKHRHSERKRHHSLNEQLKAICQLIPGSTQDSRETKVVMMQRVISYISYLENSIKVLCRQMGSKPHPSWVLLTTSFATYFHDYFKGIEDADAGDDEVFTATQNLAQSMTDMEEDRYGISRSKVSSPTVDSTTDSVVPVMVSQAEEEVLVLSQDSGVPSSSLAGDEDHISQLWSVCGASSYGDTEVFFRSSVDDGVSAVLEISSSTTDDKSLSLGLNADYIQGSDTDRRREEFTDTPHLNPSLNSTQHPSPVIRPAHSIYTLHKRVPEATQRRNKRKQQSPRRSASEDDYLSDKAYLPSWSTTTAQSAGLHAEKDWRASVVRGHLSVSCRDTCAVSSPSKARRILPYNIRCNHRHPVQRLQATGARLNITAPPTPTPPVPTPLPQSPRDPVPKTQDKVSTKLDLRRASWMNGFMMFSRLNRRNFIQAHPGVHTSHISKIMGHAWRNMSKEEQAPYKEKARLCAKELYRVYTSQPQFAHCSTLSPTTSDTNTNTGDTTTTPHVLSPPRDAKSIAQSITTE